jgi:alkylation response protein AidB-like acyl-CoA dehydrogenase
VSLGIAEAALKIAFQAVQKRETKSRNRLIGSERIAQMAVQVCASRALVERAGRFDIDTLGIDTLAAKVFASEVRERVCREVQQLLGGTSFMRGTVIDLLARDARAVALMGPVNDLALELISEEVLK